MQTVSPTGSAVSPNDSGHIPVFLLQLKKDGFADATIRCYGSDLRILAKNCELSNPESVKEWIANAKLTTTRKWSFVKEYGKYAAFCEIPFKKPKYKVEEKKSRSFPLRRKSGRLLMPPKIFGRKLLSNYCTR